MRTVLRVLIGVPLGITLGGEISGYGLYGLIAPEHLLLYFFLFATLDQLVRRLNLDAWGLFLLAMVYGAIIGGIADREGAASSDAVLKLFNLDILGLLVVVPYWGAFAVVWLHMIETWLPRRTRSATGWRRFLWIPLWLAFLFLLAGVISDSMGTKAAKPLGEGDLALGVLALALALVWLGYLRLRKVKPEAGAARGHPNKRLIGFGLAFCATQLLFGAVVPLPVRFWLTVAGQLVLLLVCISTLRKDRVYI
jgi:hypothetical protein